MSVPLLSPPSGGYTAPDGAVGGFDVERSTQLCVMFTFRWPGVWSL